jgi:formylglycine-generating enzyme
MTSRSGVLRAALCVAVILLVAVGARADFVTIGNPVNDAASASNTTHGESDAYGYGAVDYTYQISETAVSITEWAAFYTDSSSGKVGTFNAGYNYWNDDTRTVGTDAPAVRISFNQVAQYVNWLTTGDATQGAYTIDAGGAVTGIMSRADILAAAEATGKPYFLIPTEDEWYKAAYYTGSGYSLYADGTSNTGAPPTKSSDANRSVGWVYGNAFTGSNLVRPVGVGPGEQNGTLNMMGNVWEWNEAVIGSNRGLRGGSSGSVEDYLRASVRYSGGPTGVHDSIGVRVASIIPEPASVSMLLMGAVAALLWRRRRNA